MWQVLLNAAQGLFQFGAPGTSSVSFIAILLIIWLFLEFIFSVFKYFYEKLESKHEKQLEINTIEKAVKERLDAVDNKEPDKIRNEINELKTIMEARTITSDNLIERLESLYKQISEIRNEATSNSTNKVDCLAYRDNAGHRIEELEKLLKAETDWLKEKINKETKELSLKVASIEGKIERLLER